MDDEIEKATQDYLDLRDGKPITQEQARKLLSLAKRIRDFPAFQSTDHERRGGDSLGTLLYDAVEIIEEIELKQGESK